jgi:hypothetical protein
MSMKEISVKQAVTISGKSGRLIRRHLDNGNIKGRKIHNFMWLVDEQSLREWMGKPRANGYPKGKPRTR